MVWVVVLGRRLQEQMAVIRQKLRSSAVLEERNRIARELHDTLEQELAGITMQLDLAVDCFQQAPRIAQQALETARNMSRHSMVEARRSVWDLRCQLLEDGDLVFRSGPDCRASHRTRAARRWTQGSRALPFACPGQPR